MKLIAKHSVGKVLVNDGLALSAVAKKEKVLDASVINATIGTLYDENLSFFRMKTVDEIMKNLPDENYYTYAPSDGGKDFQIAAMKWVFGDSYNELTSSMACKAIPTPGGTGAVSSGLYNALDEGEILLLPDIYWSPYRNMAVSDELKIIEYPFIVNGKFNLEGFIQCSEEIIAKQGKVATILNDPCNNPTGYSLTNEEFSALIDYMNSRKNISFNIIYDIAYFDFYIAGSKAARQKFNLMQHANSNILFNIAFSCSKTFSVYGVRLGAQIIVCKDVNAVNIAYDASCFLARTRWSNVSRAGIAMLVKIDQDPKLKESVLEELKEASELVLKRAKIFTDELSAEKLTFYPYGGGFFMTVLCEDGNKLADDLVKEKIYVLGFTKAIRIAICSIPCCEVTGLAKRIKQCMK